MSLCFLLRICFFQLIAHTHIHTQEEEYLNEETTTGLQTANWFSLLA